jgi:hypothetical protein
MMPLKARRKSQRVEKVEKRYCTATSENDFLVHRTELHAHAMLRDFTAAAAKRDRRRQPLAARAPSRVTGMPERCERP